MKVLVLSSGGIDSTTALAEAVRLNGHDNVISLSITYGQTHTKELESARAVAKHYDVKHIETDISNIFKYSNSSLLKHSDDTIPKESYDEQIKKTGGETPVSTYVPFRNGIFLSIAAGIAISKGCEVICYGVHSDDAAGFAYPDCSDIFNNAMNTAIYEGSGHQVKIEAPFVNMNKADVVGRGLELGAPYELTWSCYEGGDKPCGKCGTCIDRAKAFELNGVTDPATGGRVPCRENSNI